MEIETEEENPAQGGILRQHLEAWIASRCPDHLAPFLEMSKN
jgi:hypothetical protein